MCARIAGTIVVGCICVRFTQLDGYQSRMLSPTFARLLMYLFMYHVVLCGRVMRSRYAVALCVCVTVRFLRGSIGPAPFSSSRSATVSPSYSAARTILGIPITAAQCTVVASPLHAVVQDWRQRSAFHGLTSLGGSG